MSIVKWDPFREMDDAFGRMLPSFFGRMPRLNKESGGEVYAWAPTADISETDNEFLIRAELPAVKKEDVNITVEHGVITIQGERKDQKEFKDEKFHRVESFQGNFVRSFALPENVDEEGIRAESKEGVLTVHLPKTRASKPKAIDVKVQ